MAGCGFHEIGPLLVGVVTIANVEAVERRDLVVVFAVAIIAPTATPRVPALDPLLTALAPNKFFNRTEVVVGRGRRSELEDFRGNRLRACRCRLAAGDRSE
jgi:hypothetical protein